MKRNNTTTSKKKSTSKRNDDVNNDHLERPSTKKRNNNVIETKRGYNVGIIIITVVIVVFAVAYQIQKQQRKTTASPKQRSMSQLFHLACTTLQVIGCSDYLFDIDDATRSIYTKDHHMAGQGLKRGWKLLDIPRNVQIWSEYSCLLQVACLFVCSFLRFLTLSHTHIYIHHYL
jgi:hypothetical protein